MNCIPQCSAIVQPPPELRPIHCVRSAYSAGISATNARPTWLIGHMHHARLGLRSLQIQNWRLNSPAIFLTTFFASRCCFLSDDTILTYNRKGIADEVLAKNEAARKRSLSVSSYSSVSTISTGPSRSRSRSIARKNGRPTLSLSPSGLHTSQRPPPSYTGLKRRRSRSSSADLYSSDVPPVRRRGSRHPSEDRNTRRRRSSVSPAPRGRGRNTNHGNDSAGSRTRSDSLDRSRVARRRKSLSPENRGRSSRNNLDRDRSPLRDINERQYSDRNVQRPPPPKEHSLSPFSKRVALTQAMGRATRR